MPFTYRVRWEIDIEAATAAEAAFKALQIQRDPQSIATVFDIYAGKVPLCTIDVLLDERLNQVN